MSGSIRRTLSGLAVFVLAGLLCPGLGLAALVVDPALPTTGQSFSVTTTITRNDTCWAHTSDHTVEGFVISIEITAERTSGPCLFVIRDFLVDEEIGPLSAGDYTLEVAINDSPFDTASVKVIETLPFTLLEPIDGEQGCGNIVFDWEDLPPVTRPRYELVVARNPQLTDVVLVLEEPDSSGLFLNSNDFYPPLDDTQESRLDLYWTVRAIGPLHNGEYADSVAVFDMNRNCDLSQSGGGDVIITGLVTSDLNLAALAGVSVQASILRDSGSGPQVVTVLDDTTDQAGKFIIEIGAFQDFDTVQVMVSKNDQMKQDEPEELATSSVIQSNFSLSIVTGIHLGPVLRLLLDRK